MVLDENNDIGYSLEVNVEYSKKLFGSPKDLPFTWKKKKIEKVEKLVCRIEYKRKYVIHIHMHIFCYLQENFVINMVKN